MSSKNIKNREEFQRKYFDNFKQIKFQNIPEDIVENLNELNKYLNNDLNKVEGFIVWDKNLSDEKIKNIKSSIPIYSLGMRGKYLFEFDIHIEDSNSDFLVY